MGGTVDTGCWASIPSVIAKKGGRDQNNLPRLHRISLCFSASRPAGWFVDSLHGRAVAMPTLALAVRKVRDSWRSLTKRQVRQGCRGWPSNSWWGGVIVELLRCGKVTIVGIAWREQGWNGVEGGGLGGLAKPQAAGRVFVMRQWHNTGMDCRCT